MNNISLKQIFTVSIFILIFHFSSAQIQNSIWHFGFGNMVQFTSNGPTNIDSVIAGSGEGTYCQSDSNGLLFYSNGPYVLNKNHEIMENGNEIQCDWFGSAIGMIDPLLQAGTTSAQGILALPLADNRYYLFNVTRYGSTLATGNHYKLLFTDIDMNANNGLGKVLSKNNIVFDIPFRTLGEKLAAIKHANGHDWWLIGAGARVNLTNFTLDSTFLFKVLVGYDGIKSITYQYINEFEFLGTGIGGISLNNEGTLMAICTTPIYTYIWNFDRCTGKFNLTSNLTNTLTPEITGEDQVYSCTFAPNTNLLYVSSLRKVFQFNCDASDIPGSKTLIYTNAAFNGYMTDGTIHLGAIRRALDGKIYQTKTKYPWNNPAYRMYKLNCIQNPDAIGTACNYTPNYFTTIAPNLWGLPNNEITWHLGPLIGSPCDTICFDNPVVFSDALSICQGDSVLLYGAYRYMSGTYGDTLHNYKGCDSIIHQTVLTVFSVNTNVAVNNATLTAQQGGVSYQWYNCESNMPISGATNQSYTATQSGAYYVVLTDANGCSYRSECLAVTVVGMEEIDLVQHISLYPNPAQQSVTLQADKPLNTMVVSDVVGRTLMHMKNINQTALSIDLSTLAAGVYFVKVDECRVVKLVVGY